MSKPRRQEVDYFPHYCEHGKVLFIMENNYQNDGYAVFYKLYEILAKTNGHCYDASTEEGWQYLLSKMLVPEHMVLAIIEKLVSMGTIDYDLWKDRKIWMQTFIDSVEDAYARRKVNLPTKPDKCIHATPVSGINDDILPAEPVKCQHLSAKESKVKKRIYICSSEFLQFWAAYPRKIGKDAAWKAWQKRRADMPEIDVLLASLKVQSESVDWKNENGKYIPYPTTWINQGRWADEVAPVKKDAVWS